jgi:hypothetical protein
VERHEAELAALAGEPELPALKFDLPPLEGGDFAEAQPGEREQEEEQVRSRGS